ncbi:MAG TPA: hypothetical protein QF891_04655, partial [Rhodospirillales bacterium]|nr:hypothetical protein [Rhodospirillales bacterium]
DLQVIIDDKLRSKPTVEGLSELFHIEHEKIYGFRDLESGVEVTTERVQVTGKIPPITLPKLKRKKGTKAAERRKVFYEGKFRNVPIYHRNELGAGEVIKGPAIIEQSDCTIVIIPKWSAKVDGIGNLLITADGTKTKKKK